MRDTGVVQRLKICRSCIRHTESGRGRTPYIYTVRCTVEERKRSYKCIVQGSPIKECLGFECGNSLVHRTVGEKIRTADPTPPTGELSLRCLDRGVDTDVRGGRCLTRYVVLRQDSVRFPGAESIE